MKWIIELCIADMLTSENSATIRCFINFMSALFYKQDNL